MCCVIRQVLGLEEFAVLVQDYRVVKKLTKIYCNTQVLELEEFAKLVQDDTTIYKVVKKQTQLIL